MPASEQSEAVSDPTVPLDSSPSTSRLTSIISKDTGNVVSTKGQAARSRSVDTSARRVAPVIDADDVQRSTASPSLMRTCRMSIADKPPQKLAEKSKSTSTGLKRGPVPVTSVRASTANPPRPGVAAPIAAKPAQAPPTLQKSRTQGTINTSARTQRQPTVAPQVAKRDEPPSFGRDNQTKSARSGLTRVASGKVANAVPVARASPSRQSLSTAMSRETEDDDEEEDVQNTPVKSVKAPVTPQSESKRHSLGPRILAALTHKKTPELKVQPPTPTSPANATPSPKHHLIRIPFLHHKSPTSAPSATIPASAAVAAPQTPSKTNSPLRPLPPIVGKAMAAPVPSKKSIPSTESDSPVVSRASGLGNRSTVSGGVMNRAPTQDDNDSDYDDADLPRRHNGPGQPPRWDHAARDRAFSGDDSDGDSRLNPTKLEFSEQLTLNHDEPDTARQGNDYQYFLTTISKRLKLYFDVEAEDVSDLYDILDEIGSGGYSTVFRAIDRETGEPRAIKMVNMSVYLQHKTRMEAEAHVLGSVDHPAIVKFFGVVRTPRHFCFVMELLQGRELFDRIIECKNGYPEPEACRLITIILEAVDHLHEHGVVHRDIKPENFLFDDNSECGMLKLIDFGFATFQTPNGFMIGSSCGTPDYIAPELLLEKPHNQAVDVWSVGVVLYILLCGFPPFWAETDDQLFDLIAEGKYDFPAQWDSISKEARDLVSKMLQVDVKTRWSAKQALNHPWIIRNNLINSQRLLDKRLQHLMKMKK